MDAARERIKKLEEHVEESTIFAEKQGCLLESLRDQMEGLMMEMAKSDKMNVDKDKILVAYEQARAAGLSEEEQGRALKEAIDSLVTWS